MKSSDGAHLTRWLATFGELGLSCAYAVYLFLAFGLSGLSEPQSVDRAQSLQEVVAVSVAVFMTFGALNWLLLDRRANRGLWLAAGCALIVLSGAGLGMFGG